VFELFRKTHPHGPVEPARMSDEFPAVDHAFGITNALPQLVAAISTSLPPP